VFWEKVLDTVGLVSVCVNTIPGAPEDPDYLVIVQGSLFDIFFKHPSLPSPHSHPDQEGSLSIPSPSSRKILSHLPKGFGPVPETITTFSVASCGSRSTDASIPRDLT